MRDWIIIWAPIMAAVYFLVYPDQFRQFVAWLETLIH